MTSLKDRINESVSESYGLEFDDVLLELQIQGYKIKDDKKTNTYIAIKGRSTPITIKDLKGNKLSINMGGSVNTYKYSDFLDELVVGDI